MPSETRWVCMPCYQLVPDPIVNDRTGHVTVHSDPSEPVWCPWCGDAMHPAHEVLVENEWEVVRNAEKIEEIEEYLEERDPDAE